MDETNRPPIDPQSERSGAKGIDSNRESGQHQPLVSIVTPSFNRAKYLPHAIASLAAQGYEPMEHIVADGGSSDGTIEILKRHGDRIQWSSAPDKGQADALNKAMALTRGDIIGWLNSDDIYLPGAITTAVEIFSSRPDLDLFYGSCELIDSDGRLIGRHSTKSFDVRRLIYYDSGFFTIQSMFFRRRIWDTVGPFDTSLRYALDYDWMIRAGLKCQVEYVPVVLGAFRRHSDATQSPAHRKAYRREVRLVSRRYGGRWFTPMKSMVYFALTSSPLTEQLIPVLGRSKRAVRRFVRAPDWL